MNNMGYGLMQAERLTLKLRLEMIEEQLKKEERMTDANYVIVGEEIRKLPDDKTNDPINPEHYKGKTMEAIDVIEDFDLGYNLGNVVKYVLRADHKGKRLEDLKKAAWYLNREINKESK